MNLSFDQLNTFKTVMETGSFSAAARCLAKVPSAVSMAINHLEIDLNLQLFERIGREPKPTPAAYKLYDQTLELLAEMQRWQQYVEHLTEQPAAQLTFAVVSELIHLPLQPMLHVLAQRFPALRIAIVTTTQEQALSLLAEGAAQFALMFEREHYTAMESFLELDIETLLPIAARQHPLVAQQQPIDTATLRRHRQIVIGDAIHLPRREQTELIFAKDYWLTDHQFNALQMIRQGLGWGILPLSLLQQDPDWEQQFCILNLADFTPRFDYHVDLVWRHDAALGVSGHFLIEFLKNQAQNSDFCPKSAE